MADAIRPKIFKAIKDQITSVMLQRMFALQSFDLTHDECINLIADPDHIPLLKTAAKVAHLNASEGYITVTVPYTLDGVRRPDIILNMRTHEGIEPPLRPRNAYWFAGNKQAELKITTWVEHHLRHGRMSELTAYVLRNLNDICDTSEQLRYLWPAVLHLAKAVPANHGHAELVFQWQLKHSPHKAVRSVPKIEPPLRAAMIETATWLTQAALLGEVPEEDRFGQVIIRLNTSYPFKFGELDLYRDC